MARECHDSEKRVVRGRRKDSTGYVGGRRGREGERTSRNGEKKSR